MTALAFLPLCCPQGMDERAEKGDAAHTAYKGGLDSRQARQLQAWTRELQHRLAVRPQV